jgi:hypothetical protein
MKIRVLEDGRARFEIDGETVVEREMTDAEKRKYDPPEPPKKTRKKRKK